MLRAVSPDSIELESDLALIAVVGRGMRSNRGTAGRIFSALSQVTCAENDHIVGTVQSQNLSNFRMQMLYVVAEAAEIVQILPDL